MRRHALIAFREPAAGETHHIEIIPFEADTGRVVPNVPIRVEVKDDSGAVVDAKRLNFYYAEFFHYADNFSVPNAGAYTLVATLQPPSFLRHGESGGGPRWPKAPPSRSTMSSSNQTRMTVPVSAGGALSRAVRHDVRLSWEAAAG